MYFPAFGIVTGIYQVPMRKGKSVVFSTTSHCYNDKKGTENINIQPRPPTCQKIHFLTYKLMNHITKGNLDQTMKQFQNDFTEQESDKDTVMDV